MGIIYGGVILRIRVYLWCFSLKRDIKFGVLFLFMSIIFLFSERSASRGRLTSEPTEPTLVLTVRSFFGSVRTDGSGAGITILSPSGEVQRHSYRPVHEQCFRVEGSVDCC